MNNKPRKGFGFIYKYTSPSGKSYIGQTVQSLSNRAGHNGKNYMSSQYFYSAIKKYGWSSFDVEVLGEFPIDQLNYQERKFIEVFNTMVPNGYNIQAGGIGNYHEGRKIVYQYDKNGILIRSWKGLSEPAAAVGVSIQTLSSCLHGACKTSGGYYWSYQLLEKYPVTEKIDNTNKLVTMYTLEGNKVRTFNSIGEAARYVKGERSPIKKCCRKELGYAYGYKWSCDEILAEKKYNNTPIQIEQLNKDTLEVIQTFSSISSAAKAFNKSGTSLIRRAVNDINYNAYGYKWRKAQGSTTKCP